MIDPTFEEMYISNNLLTVTFLPCGRQQYLEKSLCFRTAQSASQLQPVEQKLPSMSLLDLAQAVDLAKKQSLRAIQKLKVELSRLDSDEKASFYDLEF